MFHVPNQYRIYKGKLSSDDSYGNNGVFMFMYGDHQVKCVASDGLGWEHVSVSLKRKRCPTWNIMCYVKNLFWDEEDIIIQIHPPKSQYINQHPFCLHLWRPIGIEIPLPNPLMVGIR